MHMFCFDTNRTRQCTSPNQMLVYMYNNIYVWQLVTIHWFCWSRISLLAVTMSDEKFKQTWRRVRNNHVPLRKLYKNQRHATRFARCRVSLTVFNRSLWLLTSANRFVCLILFSFAGSHALTTSRCTNTYTQKKKLSNI